MRDSVLELGAHLGIGLRVALGLEAGVPAEIVAATGAHNLPLGASFEDVHVPPWTFRVCKQACCPSGLVLKSLQAVICAIVPLKSLTTLS